MEGFERDDCFVGVAEAGEGSLGWCVSVPYEREELEVKVPWV